MPINNNNEWFYNTHIELHRISSEVENQNQVFNAMKRTLKENTKKIKCQSKCYLFRQLKSNIGTNDVEYAVKCLHGSCSNSIKKIIKIKMMRQEISQAYEELHSS